jgi:flagellar motor switch protein FliN/FliY
MTDEEKNEATETPQDQTVPAAETPDAAPGAASDAAVAVAEPPDAAAGSDSDAEDTVEVHEAELPEPIESISRARGGQIDVLLDTSLPVEIRLGSVELEVRDLLQLGVGSVITLEKQIGEPLDLYLKGVRFATAELVVVEERLGVRITKILPRRKSDIQANPAT